MTKLGIQKQNRFYHQNSNGLTFIQEATSASEIFSRFFWWAETIFCSSSMSLFLTLPVFQKSPCPVPYSFSILANNWSSSKKKRSHWNATSASRSAPFSRCSLAVCRPPEKQYFMIFSFISFGLSVRYTAEFESDADILPCAPCNGGENFEWIRAGLPL